MIKRLFSSYSTLKSPICIGNHYLPVGDSNPHHTHDFAEFFFVTFGSLMHYYNDKKFILNARTAQFIFPENSHHFKAISKEGCRWINISFPLSLLSEDINRLLLLLFPPKEIKESNIIQIPLGIWDVYMQKIEFLSNNLDKEKQEIIFRSLLLDFLVTYMELIQPNDSIIPSWLLNTTKKFKQGDNYTNDLSWLIDVSGKSQSYLNRQMKKYYNMTPTQYMNYVRLGIAEKLLLNTNLSITEIALKASFKTIPYFSKLFKDKHDMTPSEYRQKNKHIHFTL